MKWLVKVDDVPRQCGGKLIYQFRCVPNRVLSSPARWSLQEVGRMYPGYMLIATFNHLQEEAYLACCETFTLIGQSTPIQNPNSRNKIFTAIFKA